MLLLQMKLKWKLIVQFKLVQVNQVLVLKKQALVTVVDDPGINEEFDIEPNIENIAKLDDYDFYYPPRKLKFFLFHKLKKIFELLIFFFRCKKL